MKTSRLYNGKMLPEFVFSATVKHCLFFELNVIFEDDFLTQFKEFLDGNNISSITIKNLTPKLFSFEEEIVVKNLIKSMKDIVHLEVKQDYIAETASFYMLVEQSIIFSAHDNEIFCIYIDRELWVAIFAFNNRSDEKFFIKLGNINIIEYFKLNFKDNTSYAEYSLILESNWLKMSDENSWKTTGGKPT
jgi:hypothetical protein